MSVVNIVSTAVKDQRTLSLISITRDVPVYHISLAITDAMSADVAKCVNPENGCSDWSLTPAVDVGPEIQALAQIVRCIGDGFSLGVLRRVLIVPSEKVLVWVMKAGESDDWYKNVLAGIGTTIARNVYRDSGWSTQFVVYDRGRPADAFVTLY